MPYAILVIDQDGEEEYLCDGMGDRPTRFASRQSARDMVDFMKIGMEGDVQSINVVPYPKRAASPGASLDGRPGLSDGSRDRP